MLGVVDGLEEHRPPRLTRAAGHRILGYLGAHEIKARRRKPLTVVVSHANIVCCTLADVSLTNAIRNETFDVVVIDGRRAGRAELEVLDRLGWRLNVVTPYALKRAALEAVLEQHELDATPEIYAQCLKAPRRPPGRMYPPSTRR